MNHEVSPYWVWEKELPPQICNYIIKRSINLEEDKWTRGIAGNDNKDDKEHRKNDVQFLLLFSFFCLTQSQYLKKIILKNKCPHFWTWNPDSGAFQPVPGRKFHVESEFWVKFAGFRRPGAKN